MDKQCSHFFENKEATKDESTKKKMNIYDFLSFVAIVMLCCVAVRYVFVMD